MDKQFDASYIDEELQKIGTRVKKPLNIYLIGGCAMSFRKLKETTRDVDMVLRNKEDLQILSDALLMAQYYSPFQIKVEHEKLEPMKVYENKDEFHLDLFIEKIVGKLYLSESMISRAELHKIYGKLSVYLLSKEDIFLFKGLASEGRKRDLPDMERLYPRMDWKIIENELEGQKLSAELKGLLKRRLEEFSKVYRLDVPLLKKIK
ncbi:MAG: DUF6036 family nucleotidyltransferase [Candidatus Micrarchaeia archaeon]|jgi:hypothetical protein